jgi:predicted nucleic-acid-binding protein
MIALDTNILLRYLVQDDAVQSQLASDVLENRLTSDEPGFVSITALLELDWVLRVQYGFSQANVCAVLTGLLSASNLICEQRECVARALQFEHGDLADNILHQTAKEAGCTQTLTFDKKFARLEGVELLK